MMIAHTASRTRLSSVALARFVPRALAQLVLSPVVSAPHWRSIRRLVHRSCEHATVSFAEPVASTCLRFGTAEQRATSCRPCMLCPVICFSCNKRVAGLWYDLESLQALAAKRPTF